MSVVGILIALGLLVWLAYRGWSILLLAPLSALIAALLAGQPLLANWTQTFMSNAAGFVAQFFPIFLLGALFGKLMEASGSVEAIAKYLTERLGTKRAMLAIVLAGAFVTYGGVSLFVAFFVLAPMGHALFKAANIPHRLMPAAIALGTSTFTMSAMPGTPAIQNAIPMPFFGTSPFAAPGLGLTASAIMPRRLDIQLENCLKVYLAMTNVLNDASRSRLRPGIVELTEPLRRRHSVAHKSALSRYAQVTPRTSSNLRFHRGQLLRYDRRAELNMASRLQS